MSAATHVSMRRTLPAVFLLIAQAAAGPGLELRGSMTADLSVLHDYRAESADQADFNGLSRLSLTFLNVNREKAKIEGSFDVLMLYGAAAGQYDGLFAETDPVQELLSQGSTYLLSIGRAPLLLDLRRLYLSFYLPFADISIGRQIINFGTGAVFSPIDVFSSVDVFDLDLRRRGSDVARVRIPFGNVAGADLIGEMPVGDNPFSAAAKLYATFGETDIALIGMYRDPGHDGGSREGVVGLTARGDLVLGVYGEAVMHIVQDAPRVYTEVMCGADYSIRNTWIFMAEYQYKDHAWKGGNWGEHAAIFSMQFIPLELLSFSGSFLYDFQHRLALGTILGRYNVLQNVYLELYGRGMSGMDGVPYDAAYGMRVEVKF